MIRVDGEHGRHLDPVQSLWACVLRQALIDAKALGRYGDESREEAREWLRGGDGRDRVLDLTGIDPDAFEGQLPRLEAEWRVVDAKIARLRAKGHQSGRWAKPAEHSPDLAP